MGGPCLLVQQEGGKRRVPAPACTDNFQVRAFEVSGAHFFSCEHAYQALKYAAGSAARQKIADIKPFAAESDSSHGMRCWLAGNQLAKEKMIPNWDSVKLDVMLEVNRAKYAQNVDLRAELLATGTTTIVGCRSTQWSWNGKHHKWADWNGRIQMLIREESRPEQERNADLVASLHAMFRSYSNPEPHTRPEQL
jgi:predicted NAD-dependent protein-ADP-ribosyltransferase YbiA (DUF1768 family)